MSPDEVEDVLYARPYLEKKGRSGSLLVYGQTAVGRYLFVVTAPAMDGGTFIVTARDMGPNERREFQQKAR